MNNSPLNHLHNCFHVFVFSRISAGLWNQTAGICGPIPGANRSLAGPSAAILANMASHSTGSSLEGVRLEFRSGLSAGQTTCSTPNRVITKISWIVYRRQETAKHEVRGAAVSPADVTMGCRLAFSQWTKLKVSTLKSLSLCLLAVISVSALWTL